MKKINNKGFTLIELLVVLVLLVVIMSIAIPSVTSSIERSKTKQKQQKIELLRSAGELYYDDHKNSLAGIIIDAKLLICAGYITKEQAKDPTNESYPIKGCYQYGAWDEGCIYYNYSSLDDINPPC